MGAFGGQKKFLMIFFFFKFKELAVSVFTERERGERWRN